MNDKITGVYILQNTLAWGGGMVPGKKIKRGSEEQKEKEEMEKGRVIFFVNIWHTFVDN